MNVLPDFRTGPPSPVPLQSGHVLLTVDALLMFENLSERRLPIVLICRDFVAQTATSEAIAARTAVIGQRVPVRAARIGG
jgi:hypothetical protein